MNGFDTVRKYVNEKSLLDDNEDNDYYDNDNSTDESDYSDKNKSNGFKSNSEDKSNRKKF